MKKKLSPWSKKVKKAMIEYDMDTNDVAEKFGWTRQYASTVINGGRYYKEAVIRISQLFDIEIPSENATLARNFEAEHE